MLSFFDSITVPGLEKVTVYRDDEDAYRFYVMPSTPRIARDDSGELLLQLMIYARNVDTLPPDQLEAQRGWIAASVELRLTPEEEDKVRAYLKELINAGNHLWFARFFRLRLDPAEPKITLPPEWLSGDVALSIPTPGGTSTVSTSKPSLISTNVATLAGDLSQDSSELLRQAVLKGGLPMAVNYTDLTFVARIPSITVRIHGDRSAFLRETIERYQITHTIVHREEVDLGLISWTTEWWQQWTTNHTSVDQFQQITQSITLEVEDSDFRTEPEYVAIRAKFEAMALEIFTASVVPSIMADVSKAFDAARTAAAGDPAKPAPPCSVQTLVSTISGSVDMTLSKSAVVQLKKNPNGALARDLTPEQITKAVTYIDLSDPYFRELFLHVHANVNFATDPVFGLKVNVEYEQQDEQMTRVVKGAKSMLFTSADQVQTFRQILARGADGATKDEYRYWSEIIYKETGQTIRVPATGTLPGKGNELVISYRSLGFVKVLATLGPQPAEVASVKVSFSYPRSAAATATQSFELTTANPTATYFTYAGHPGEPEPYTYTLTYVLTDGQQMDVPPATSRGATLAVGSPFESRVSATFVAQADFTVVDKIILDATYSDPANDLTLNHHAELAGNGASDAWSVALRNPALTGFTYSTLVLYKNGSSEQRGPTSATLGTTVPVGVGATAALEVMLVPNLDATRPTAVVQMTYDDPAAGVHQAQNYTMGMTDAPATFRVLLRNPEARAYRYRIQLLATASAPVWDSGWRDGTDTVLLVRADQAPPPPPTPAPPPPT
ncbi:MAG TPA: hypothetical protein VHM65_02230, partial [Candidatus Lustribacter sp.]|nr:hypothetical protein [Candidatus Lustribacter sp.]